MSLEFPRLGYGASAIAGLYRPITAQQSHEVMETAWAEGLRYFDVAPHYGQGLAERRLGDFLRDKDSTDWLLSTKVGRVLAPSTNANDTLNGFVKPLPFTQHFDYSYDGIMRSVEDSYQRLGLSRIDILYVHDLGEAGLGTDDPLIIADFVKSGYRALEDLKKEGSIRAVGLGVNTIGICEDLLSKIDLDVILLAGRYTLLEPFQALPLLETCRQKGTQLVIGGVFNSGIMATGPVKGAHYDYGPAPRSVLDRVGAIQEICDRHDVPLAAAAFRFPGLHEAVACTLVGTAKQTTLSRNLAQSKLPIPEAVWTDLAAAGLLDMGAS